MATPDDPGAAEARSDITPMIDVVFLMIVFFVCIDFRVLECKLPAWLPKDEGSSPDVVAPQEQLPVRVHVVEPGTPVYAAGVPTSGIDPATGRPARFRLHDHRVRWEVGPHRLDDVTAVRRELERIARDPTSQVPDESSGGRKLLACVVEAAPGACYDDVAKTVDACRAAGFAEVRFGGGLGPVR